MKIRAQALDANQSEERGAGGGGDRANSLVVSSDLGQNANMVHPDGIETAIAAMKREGISDADIDLMMRKNPARLLGLSN